MLRRTQDPLKREYIFNYRIITFFDSSFQMIRLIYSFVTPYRVSYNPNKQAYWFGLFRFARRYSGNRFFFLFLRVLRCFSSPGLPSDMLCIHMSITRHNSCWVPHSEISGSTLTYSYPKHIVVSNVLHRLLVPRHPPCALNNLIYVSTILERSSNFRNLLLIL